MGQGEQRHGGVHEHAGDIEGAHSARAGQEYRVREDAGAGALGGGHAVGVGVGRGGRQRDGHAVLHRLTTGRAVFARQILVDEKAGLLRPAINERPVQRIARRIGGSGVGVGVDPGNINRICAVGGVARRACRADAVVELGHEDHHRAVGVLVVAIVGIGRVVVAGECREAAGQGLGVHAYTKALAACGADQPTEGVLGNKAKRAGPLGCAVAGAGVAHAPVVGLRLRQPGSRIAGEVAGITRDIDHQTGEAAVRGHLPVGTGMGVFQAEPAKRRGGQGHAAVLVGRAIARAGVGRRLHSGGQNLNAERGGVAVHRDGEGVGAIGARRGVGDGVAVNTHRAVGRLHQIGTEHRVVGDGVGDFLGDIDIGGAV